MEAVEFKNKCENLIEQFEDRIANGLTYHGYEGVDKVLREFRHLVYAFDQNLPLNMELSEPNALNLTSPYVSPDGNKADKERILGYMRFFVNYIESYCE